MEQCVVAPLAVRFVLSSHLLCSHSITFIDTLCSPTPHIDITSMWVILVIVVVFVVAVFKMCALNFRNCCLIRELCVSLNTLPSRQLSQARQLPIPKTHGTVSSLHTRMCISQTIQLALQRSSIECLNIACIKRQRE